MKRQVRRTAILGAVFVTAAFLFAVRPNVWCQLVLMFGSLVVAGFGLVNLVLVAKWWKEHRLRACLAVAIFVATVVLTVPAILAGHLVRDGIFSLQRSRYDTVISMMQGGDIPVPTGTFERVSIPAKYWDLAMATLAHRDTNGVLTVEFLIGGGFPVKHAGYLYRSSGTLSEWEHARRWPRRKQMDDRWYRISD